MFKEFLASAKTSKVVSTGSWVLGESGINEIPVISSSEVNHRTNYKPVTSILGYNVTFNDTHE
jgi:malate/lactate dehydrogenase